MSKFYNLVQNGKSMELYLFGDICTEKWSETDVTAKSIVEQIKGADVDEITVRIASYGGEVQAGVAIYNILKAHKAKVTTICDSFACSIASVIFMAGDERIMNEASLLMIHNAWTLTQGNADELRKQADDLDKITQLSVEAYKAHSSLSEEEIKELMNNETWILPSEALAYGFATSIKAGDNSNAKQNAFKQLFDIIKAHQETEEPEEEVVEAEDDEEIEEPAEPETTEEPETEEPEDDEEETPSDDETEEENPEKDEEKSANQKLVSFFNAILKM